MEPQIIREPKNSFNFSEIRAVLFIVLMTVPIFIVTYFTNVKNRSLKSQAEIPVNPPDVSYKKGIAGPVAPDKLTELKASWF